MFILKTVYLISMSPKLYLKKPREVHERATKVFSGLNWLLRSICLKEWWLGCTVEVYTIVSVRGKKIKNKRLIFFQDQNKTIQVKWGESKCKTKVTFHAEDNGCVELLSKRWCAYQKFTELLGKFMGRNNITENNETSCTLTNLLSWK